jgi:hypothetical protein
MGVHVKLAITAVLIAVLGLPAGCTDQNTLVLHFRNETNKALDVFLLNPDTNQESAMQRDIRPNETTITRGDIFPGASCSSRGILIARDKQGNEIARHTGNTCPGETWVIEASGPSPSG